MRCPPSYTIGALLLLLTPAAPVPLPATPNLATPLLNNTRYEPPLGGCSVLVGVRGAGGGGGFSHPSGGAGALFNVSFFLDNSTFLTPIMGAGGAIGIGGGTGGGGATALLLNGSLLLAVAGGGGGSGYGSGFGGSGGPPGGNGSSGGSTDAGHTGGGGGTQAGPGACGWTADVGTAAQFGQGSAGGNGGLYSVSTIGVLGGAGWAR